MYKTPFCKFGHIFGSVKAYNIIQMFQFVTEIMERYYQSKLLSVAHTRVDRFISVRYQGLNAKQYSKDSITKLSDSTFSVPSKTKILDGHVHGPVHMPPR